MKKYVRIVEDIFTVYVDEEVFEKIFRNDIDNVIVEIETWREVCDDECVIFRVEKKLFENDFDVFDDIKNNILKFDY